MMVRSLSIKPDRTSPRCLVIDTLLMRMRARPNPPSCWSCSWWDTDEKELLTSIKK
jgi:hypothetical protein